MSLRLGGLQQWTTGIDSLLFTMLMITFFMKLFWQSQCQGLPDRSTEERLIHCTREEDMEDNPLLLRSRCFKLGWCPNAFSWIKLRFLFQDNFKYSRSESVWNAFSVTLCKFEHPEMSSLFNLLREENAMSSITLKLLGFF